MGSGHSSTQQQNPSGPRTQTVK